MASSTNNWEEKFEERINKIEKKLENIGKQAEEKGKKIGQDIEKEVQKITKDFRGKKEHEHHLFWGVVLIAVGVLWLGRNMDWFYFDIPWVPVVMIAGGIYMIINHHKKEESKDP